LALDVAILPFLGRRMIDNIGEGGKHRRENEDTEELHGDRITG
jgi:hypothetical protein